MPLDGGPQHVQLPFLLGPLLLRVDAVDPESLALTADWLPTIALGLALATRIARPGGPDLRGGQHNPGSIARNQNLAGGSLSNGGLGGWAGTAGLARWRDLPSTHLGTVDICQMKERL